MAKIEVEDARIALCGSQKPQLSCPRTKKTLNVRAVNFTLQD